LKLKHLNWTITTNENMTKNVLCYPADRSFPLVDMYYKDENDNLVGIKATMADKHDNQSTKDLYELLWKNWDRSR